MRDRLVTLGLALAFGVLAACDARPLSPVGSSALAVQDQTANPSDPFGACLVDQHTHGWFDCSQGNTTCTGWGGGTCVQGDCPAVYHAVCDHTCQVDADCPVPATGNVQPICQTSVHSCQLPCDNNHSCPNGYVCQSTRDWGLFDGSGNPIPAPFMCMQTINDSGEADGGRWGP
jgi:hypothetical protein